MASGDRGRGDAFTPPMDVADLERSAEEIADGLENSDTAWDRFDDLLLQSWPANVPRSASSRTSQGSTALHLAAKFGRLEVVKKLVQTHDSASVGETIGAQTVKGMTPMHLAAQGGHDKVLKFLIECCPPRDLRNFVNKRGYSTWEEGDDEPPSSASGNRPTIARGFSFRISKKMKIRSSSSSKTALHYASENGYPGVVTTLLACREVDPNLRDCQEYTPLHLAILRSKSKISRRHLPSWREQSIDHFAVVKKLIEARGGERVDVNAEGFWGDTPLHSAVRVANLDVVKLLCDHPWILASKENEKGRTPLRLAWEEPRSDKMEITKELLMRRPDVQRNVEDVKRQHEALRSALNSVFVVGTLLACLTYAATLATPTIPPSSIFSNTSESDARQLRNQYEKVIAIFRISNSVGYYFSIVVLISTVKLMISRRYVTNEAPILEEEVAHLHGWSVFIHICLVVAAASVITAFISGGLAIIPVEQTEGVQLVASIADVRIHQLPISICGGLFCAFLVLQVFFCACNDQYHIIRYRCSAVTWSSFLIFLSLIGGLGILGYIIALGIDSALF